MSCWFFSGPIQECVGGPAGWHIRPLQDSLEPWRWPPDRTERPDRDLLVPTLRSSQTERYNYPELSATTRYPHASSWQPSERRPSMENVYKGPGRYDWMNHQSIKFLPKGVGRRAKTSFPSRKAFTPGFWCIVGGSWGFIEVLLQTDVNVAKLGFQTFKTNVKLLSKLLYHCRFCTFYSINNLLQR